MKKSLLLIPLLLLVISAFAQHTPIEVFAGDKKLTVDMLLAKYLKNKKDAPSQFFFFSRSRAILDYKMTSSTNLPQFAVTEALSYDFSFLRGFAPVAVIQVFNRGVYPRAGIRYFKAMRSLSFFGWVVADVVGKTSTDVFILTRYTPSLSKQWRLYSQAELVNDFPIGHEANFNFTQRLRLGLATGLISFGAAIDLSETGRSKYTNLSNAGLFFRFEL